MAFLKQSWFPTILFGLGFLTLGSAQSDDAIITAIRPCPTITVTSSRPVNLCPSSTPIFCAVPHCIVASTISVPCGCPTTVPTSTKYYPCATTCVGGGCGTAYKTILPSTRCPTLPTLPTTKSPIPTTPPTSTCQTITVTSGSDCPKTPTTCTYVPDCIYLSSVTSRCGCGTKGVVESTICRTTCVQGCLTQFLTVTDSVGKPCATTAG